MVLPTKSRIGFEKSVVIWVDCWKQIENFDMVASGVYQITAVIVCPWWHSILSVGKSFLREILSKSSNSLFQLHKFYFLLRII